MEILSLRVQAQSKSLRALCGREYEENARIKLLLKIIIIKMKKGKKIFLRHLAFYQNEPFLFMNTNFLRETSWFDSLGKLETSS